MYGNVYNVKCRDDFLVIIMSLSYVAVHWECFWGDRGLRGPSNFIVGFID